LPKKKKKIKRADQILPEVYGTTLNKNIFQQIKKTAKEENQIKVEQTIQMYRDVPKVFGH
jgi:phage baseplate assembly protein W